MSQNVTMQDIADALNIGKATVSRAFRGNPKCGAALREKILAKAEELGYSPDPLHSLHMARLRANHPAAERGTVIGFLDMYPPELSIRQNPSNRRFLQGAESKAKALGLKVEVFQPEADKISLTRLRSILHARSIHGLIIAPMPRAHGRLDFNFEGIAAVAIAHSLEWPILHRVGHNHYQMMWKIMQALHDEGRRRIGIAVEASINERIGQRWHAAYYEFCRTHQVMKQLPPFRFEWDAVNWDSRKDHFQPLCDWLQKNQVDTVLGLDPWFIEAMQQQSPTLPHPAEYIDLDNYPGKSSYQNRAVEQRFEAIGAAAVDEIIGQWTRREYGVPADPKTILLAGQLSENEL